MNAVIAAVALIVWAGPLKDIPPETHRGHAACLEEGRKAEARGDAREWACVSLRGRR